MTREELKRHCKKQVENCEMWAKCKGEEPHGKVYEEHKLILELLEQEPCEDAISRQAVLDGIDTYINKAHSTGTQDDFYSFAELVVKELPSVTSKQKTGHCKDCKYFEYNSMAKVDGIPLIVAHEICNKWGNGCKSKEDGYCFLYEPRERSDKE